MIDNIAKWLKKKKSPLDKSKDGIKWELIQENEYGNWEWMLTDGGKRIGRIYRYSGCDKWSILIQDKGCKNKEKYINKEDTAKAVVLEAATSDSKLYRRALFKTVDMGFFETLTLHEAKVEMERINRFAEMIKSVLSEMFIETIDTGDGGIRVIHEESFFSKPR